MGTPDTDSSTADAFLRTFARTGGAPESVDLAGVSFTAAHPLPSVFAVTDFAAASIAAAAVATRDLATALGGSPGTITVDRDLASWWFVCSIFPDGWQLPAAWDAVAGDYASSDGWIRLHTNAPHHRLAALDVLGIPDSEAIRDDVARRVTEWTADDLEAAVVGNGGCAAAMRDAAAWATHPQGTAVRAEPLLHHRTTSTAVGAANGGRPDRPLAGVRVLDLTRVLAGPIATRFLAGLGADVLRIDPLDWNEASLEPEVTLGKRCARIDLRTAAGADALRALLAGADIVVHGYRPDALAALGLGDDARADIRPGLVDIALDAYGWTGPWADRRGFDSLVQMSCGIAAAGMVAAAAPQPKPLPAQALDHATGYLLAAAAIRGWTQRLRDGVGCTTRASLARTAFALTDGSSGSLDDPGPDLAHALTTASTETTPWGAASRLRFPATIDGSPIRWDRQANALGSGSPRWLDRRAN